MREEIRRLELRMIQKSGGRRFSAGFTFLGSGTPWVR